MGGPWTPVVCDARSEEDASQRCDDLEVAGRDVHATQRVVDPPRWASVLLDRGRRHPSNPREQRGAVVRSGDDVRHPRSAMFCAGRLCVDHDRERPRHQIDVSDIGLVERRALASGLRAVGRQGNLRMKERDGPSGGRDHVERARDIVGTEDFRVSRVEHPPGKDHRHRLGGRHDGAVPLPARDEDRGGELDAARVAARAVADGLRRRLLA